MRGLSGRGDESGIGGVRAAGGTAAAVLAALGLFAAGCSTGGTGPRDEGAARTSAGNPQVAPAPSTSSAPVRKVNPVRLILGDPKVSDQVKEDLKPCAEDTFPLDTSYGKLTGGSEQDVVVNVLTCGDAIGVGTFVYRARDGEYENVFSLEEPAVYATIDRGELVLTKQVYGSDDPVSSPSGEDVITYRWADGKFSEHDRVHNDFNKSVADDDGTGVEPPRQTPGDG
ncbi:hypothetical protein NX801_29405 [Streptomyces sp. LP05-1]|uniref:Lipoprotein CseA n=1 Tax=Streptomyces pyxinae TaxID=2970734 RepID=A0ABT2CQZ0_9ACTN|nr:hypothetical protein [Streptomyces sp. LP05-1]MCS0639681.1 hypothetical protein [Streptomyces sp. LP05-1]